MGREHRRRRGRAAGPALPQCRQPGQVRVPTGQRALGGGEQRADFGVHSVVGEARRGDVPVRRRVRSGATAGQGVVKHQPGEQAEQLAVEGEVADRVERLELQPADLGGEPRGLGE